MGMIQVVKGIGIGHLQVCVVAAGRLFCRLRLV